MVQSGLSPRSRARPALTLLAAAFGCACSALCLGAEGTERRALDAARSSADFEVKVLWLIGVHGRFGKVHGGVTIDRTRDTLAVDARVDVDVITMRNHSYEDWVKSDEFFDAKAHPQIRFVASAVPLDRLRGGGDIDGTLTVRGIERPLRLHVEPSACPDAVAGDCPVEASGTIRRGEFGMTTRRRTVADKVDLGFSIYLAPADAAAEPAK